MVKGLEHLLYEEMLKELGSFRGGSGNISSISEGKMQKGWRHVLCSGA